MKGSVIRVSVCKLSGHLNMCLSAHFIASILRNKQVTMSFVIRRSCSVYKISSNYYNYSYEIIKIHSWGIVNHLALGGLKHSLEDLYSNT